MSDRRRVPFDEALEVARQVSEVLTPTVAELKAVGSLRRKRETVGDLEFLARPHFDGDLFDPAKASPVLDPLRLALHELGTWHKGGDRQMVVDDVFGSSLRLEVFIAHPPAQWGSLLAIRTGPADLGQYCVTCMLGRGFQHHLGRVLVKKTRELHPTPTEEDFFAAAGVECVPPVRRDALAAKLTGAGPYQRMSRRGYSTP